MLGWLFKSANNEHKEIVLNEWFVEVLITYIDSNDPIEYKTFTYPISKWDQLKPRKDIWSQKIVHNDIYRYNKLIMIDIAEETARKLVKQGFVDQFNDNRFVMPHEIEKVVISEPGTLSINQTVFVDKNIPTKYKSVI